MGLPSSVMANSSRRTAVQAAPTPLDATVVQDPDARAGPAGPRLLVVSGPRAGAVIAIRGDALTLGRGWDNDVVLPDISVSRRHALLRREATGYVLVDHASGNGTRVNGRTVDRARLRSGDEIGLGDSIVRFVDGNAVAVRRAGDVRAAIVGATARLRGRSAADAAIAAVLVVAIAIGLWRRHGREEMVQPMAVSQDLHGPDTAEVIAPAAQAAPPLERSDEKAAPGGAPADGGLQAGDSRQVRRPPPRTKAAALAVRSAPVAPRILRAYLAGDLAAATEMARAAPVGSGVAETLARLEEFAAARTEGAAQLGEDRIAEAIAAFEKADRADRALASGRDGPLGRDVRSALSRLHLQASLRTDSDAGAAAGHLRAAVDLDPANASARERLRQITARATDAYLRGYVAKDGDAEAASEAFRFVLAVLPAEDDLARKARRWLDRLDGTAVGEE